MNNNLELYRVFCEVVKFKSISKASENMYISQSAVSQSIKKLEDSLGGTVFYRTKTGVELTEPGKNLYDYIKDSIDTISNAENIFSEYNNLDKGNLRIGSGNTIFNSMAIDTVIKFMRKYPNIDIRLIGGMTEKLVKDLSNGELDVVMLNLPYLGKEYANIEFIPLKTCKYVFYASKEYIRKNNIKDLNDKNIRFIVSKYPTSKRKICEKICKLNNIELINVHEITNSLITKSMVLADIGVGFGNIESLNDISDKIEVFTNIEVPLENEGIAILENNICSKPVKMLKKMLKEKYDKA